MNSRLLGMIIASLLVNWSVGRAADPRTHRIAVVDTSSSMVGTRIDTVKSELAEHGRKYPPSATDPLTVVLFDHEVRDVQSFTDPGSFQRYVPTINVCGGTCIAAGLKRAVAEARKSNKSAHVVVMLYTDGEDGDQAQILAAEEELDKLFSERSQVGLAQTVVFCKRWGGANAELLAKITQRGRAAVIDGGETSLTPVKLTPRARVKEVKWSLTHPGSAEVILEGWVDADTAIAGDPPLARLTQKKDPTALPIAIGTRPVTFTTRINVTRAEAEARTTSLELLASTTGAVSQGKGLVWPLIVEPLIRLPVTLPKQHRAIYTVQVTPTPARWVDPVSETAEWGVTVAIQVTPSVEEGPVAGLPFTAVAGSEVQITSGSAQWPVAGSGVTSQSLTLRAGSSAIQTTTNGPVFETSLTIGPRELPSHVTFEPAQLKVPVRVPLPPSVRSVITARVLSARCPGWIDPVQGIAAVQAEVELAVQGVVPPGVSATAQGSGALRGLKFSSHRLQTTPAKVRLSGQCTFTPGSPELPAQWSLTAPPRRTAIEWVEPGPISIRLTAPPPARLALRSLDPRATSLVVNLPAFADETQWITQIELKGLVGTDRVECPATARSDCPAFGTWPSRLRAPGTVSVHVRTPEGPRSFFRDSVTATEVTIEPATPGPWLVGSTQPVKIYQEAPFKRLLFYLAIALGGVATIWCLIRTFGRLTRGPEIAALGDPGAMS